MTNVRNLIIVALVGVIAVGGALVYAQSSRTADVEVRVWESTGDPLRNYISARPAGGSWSTLGTIPLGQGRASAYETTSNGRFRYSDITLAVPLPDGAAAPSGAPSAAECADRYRDLLEVFRNSGGDGGWGSFALWLASLAGVGDGEHRLSLLALPAVQVALRQQGGDFSTAAASFGEACVSRFVCWDTSLANDLMVPWEFRRSPSLSAGWSEPPPALDTCVVPDPVPSPLVGLDYDNIPRAELDVAITNSAYSGQLRVVAVRHDPGLGGGEIAPYQLWVNVASPGRASDGRFYNRGFVSQGYGQYSLEDINPVYYDHPRINTVSAVRIGLWTSEFFNCHRQRTSTEEWSIFRCVQK